MATDHELYRALGRTPQERQSAYRALFQGTLDEGELQDLRSTLNQCRVLGTERFKDTIERVLLRRVRSGKAGRPRQQAKLLKDEVADGGAARGLPVVQLSGQNRHASHPVIRCLSLLSRAGVHGQGAGAALPRLCHGRSARGEMGTDSAGRATRASDRESAVSGCCWRQAWYASCRAWARETPKRRAAPGTIKPPRGELTP